MIDVLTDSNSDLQIANNDLLVGESTIQHQNHLLVSVPGDLKEDPLAAVGLALYLKDDSLADGLLGTIKEKFERDGMKVNSLTIDNEGNLNTDAYYTEISDID